MSPRLNPAEIQVNIASFRMMDMIVDRGCRIESARKRKGWRLVAILDVACRESQPRSDRKSESL